MDIKDILQSLGLDFTNPEAKKGAMEAIAAILAGRQGQSMAPSGNMTGDGDVDLGEHDMDVDPNLIQPPQLNSSGQSNIETEIQDDEDLLKQVKSLDQTSGLENDSEDIDNKQDSDNQGDSGDSSKSSDSESSDTGDAQQSKDSGSADGQDGAEQDDYQTNATAEDDSTNTTDDDATDDTTDIEKYSDGDLSSQLSGTNPKNESQRIQIGRTIRAAEQALDKAKTSNGQEGIKKALEKCKDMLEEMQDELEADETSSIADQKFNQVVSRTLDNIANLNQKDISIKSDEERAQQVKKIKADMADAGTAAELSAEDAEQIRAENQAIISSDKEIEKYRRRNSNSFSGFDSFITSLKKALAMQVTTDTEKASSWSAINRRYDGTGVMKPGIKNKQLPNKKIPVIDFYFDCSGSWGDRDIQKGNEALSQIAQLEKDGLIKINIFYFADHVHTSPEPARWEGTTRAWNDIVTNIITTRATNVVIMTDSDMRRYAETGKGYKVPGVVWFLWKNGDNAQSMPQKLQGKSGTLQYSFSSY